MICSNKESGSSVLERGLLLGLNLVGYNTPHLGGRVRRIATANESAGVVVCIFLLGSEIWDCIKLFHFNVVTIYFYFHFPYSWGHFILVTNKCMRLYAHMHSLFEFSALVLITGAHIYIHSQLLLSFTF